MIADGYDLGNVKLLIQKVEQKWGNMLRNYKTFLAESNKTGSGAGVLDTEPKFSKEIREILGNYLLCK